MRRLKSGLLLGVLVTLTLLTVCASNPNRMLFGRPIGGFVVQHYTVKEVQRIIDNGELVGLTNGFFKQKLDHRATDKDADYNTTFDQLFFRNDQYYRDGGPQFLYIAGEGPESGHALVTTDPKRITPMMKWAEMEGARAWILEHRFYGQSRPFTQQTTDVLEKYLNSEQALDDLAEFIRAKNAELSLNNPKWIVFGGSYAGALALWFRQRYPTLTVGAIGSSGPIDARFDFYDYLRVCEESYKSDFGSDSCADAIQLAFKTVQNLMQYKGGRDYLDSAFSLYPKFSQEDLNSTTIQNFYANLISQFQGAVQYNKINGGIYATGAGIEEICDRITHPKSFSMIGGLINVIEYLSEVNGLKFDKFFNSYQDDINLIKDPNYYGDGDLAAARSWTWQTCNEFGYYQSTDTGSNIFGDTVQNTFYINQCVEIFGDKYDYNYVKKQVKATIDKYGGRTKYTGKNAVATNGKIDPWHALGFHVGDPVDATVKIHVMEKTAHCAELGPERDHDSQELKNTRATIYQNIHDWLTGTPTLREKRSLDDAQLVETNKQNKLGQELGAQLKTAEESAFANHPKLIDKQKLEDNPLITPEDFNQELDHDHDTPRKPFRQQLYRVSKYEKTADPPLILFLLLDDEAISYFPNGNENAPIATFASACNATLLFVKCRFFGNSRPDTELKTDNLALLTLDQAMKDVLKIISDHPGRTTAYKKVAVVGSGLGGTLAAHLRRMNPSIIDAALASSAPLDFQLTYPDGLNTLQDSLYKYDKDCADGIGSFFDKIYRLFNERDGRKTLIDSNLICATQLPDADYIDLSIKNVFTARVLGQVVVMANGIAQDKANFDLLCNTAKNNVSTIIDKIKALFPTGCIDVDYNTFAGGYEDATNKDNDPRVKTYLQCNEVGFLPNTDFGRNIFGSTLSPNFYVDLCKNSFGLAHKDMHGNIEKTRNLYHEANQFDGTNVIFTYGTFDFYNPATFHGDVHGEDRLLLEIANAGVSSDLLPSVTTTEAVTAREHIIFYLNQWLQPTT